MVDARTATAADFDDAAQQQANKAWVWAVMTGVTVWLGGWYGAIPGFVTFMAIVKSVVATSCASKLRAGTYSIPNPNNGAPDGDASRGQQR